MNNTGKNKAEKHISTATSYCNAIYLVFLHAVQLNLTRACLRSSQHWRSTILRTLT